MAWCNPKDCVHMDSDYCSQCYGSDKGDRNREFRFKVGDKVIVENLKNGTYCIGWLNKVGTIIKVLKSNSIYPYLVEFAKSINVYGFSSPQKDERLFSENNLKLHQRK